MTRINLLLLLLQVTLLLSSPPILLVEAQHQDETTSTAKTCPHGKEEDGTCSAPAEKRPPPPICGSDSRCSATATPFYQRGGTAQAYKPNAPVKSSVCDSDRTRYKASTWPHGRSNQRTAPTVTVQLNLYECLSYESMDKKTRTKTEECCCTRTDDTGIQIEVWQTQPNGRYSSLTPGTDDGVCRATLPGTQFSTVAPGSTGILGGLGPHGWDIGPYGPPSIHILTSSAEHDPLLVHVPMTLDRATLESRSFFGPDWRGPAYVTTKVPAEQQSFSIEKWTVVGDDKDAIDMTVNLYLTTSDDDDDGPTDIRNALCPSSSWYGSPSSFFLEPISVCAPSLLDFFPM